MSYSPSTQASDTRHFLEGKQFVLLTDFDPLTFDLQARPDKYSPCEVRQLDSISQCTNDIRYIPGGYHIVADTLPRPQPIYPMFTENIREVVRVVRFGKSWWRKLYERTRLPFVLFYGYFPVKLRTYIGDPIYPQEGETPEQLAQRTKQAMAELIRTHQWTPSNLLCAILQRVPSFDHWLEKHKQRKLALIN
ncbi:unnamed protein product [Dicrocoelium dendriticum]|nr:unnamed protein product [Dicrocoelium dendriticum]